MNVVDASGWLEYFADGPDAAFVAQTLQETDRLIVPTVTILEVFGSILRTHGESGALQAAAAMQQGKVVPLDATGSLEAGRMAVGHDVPIAPSIALAAARRHGATIWSLDERLRGIEGVKFHARSRGAFGGG